MMFLNAYEIDEAARMFASDPILGPATRTLANLRDAADAHSDGWAYWPKPARAARALMVIVDRERLRALRYAGEPTTADDVRRALRPIKAFRTRSGIDFEIETP